MAQILQDTIGLIKRAAEPGQPVIVGIDGRSGTGKSTFAASLASSISAQIIEGDAFFAGGVNVRRDTPEERANACIDRPKMRSVLEALSAGRAAVYREFDWDAFDGRLKQKLTTVMTGKYIIVEGAYSCHPDLADLLQVKIKLQISDDLRERRLIQREGSIGPWERQWHEAEEWYFSHLAIYAHFNLIGE